MLYFIDISNLASTTHFISYIHQVRLERQKKTQKGSRLSMPVAIGKPRVMKARNQPKLRRVCLWEIDLSFNEF
jgi:hypothetical protein